MTFDEWYDDPATQDALPVKARDVTRAAYEAGARSMDEEVAALKAALVETLGELYDTAKDDMNHPADGEVSTVYDEVRLPNGMGREDWIAARLTRKLLPVCRREGPALREIQNEGAHGHERARGAQLRCGHCNEWCEPACPSCGHELLEHVPSTAAPVPPESVRAEDKVLLEAADGSRLVRAEGHFASRPPAPAFEPKTSAAVCRCGHSLRGHFGDGKRACMQDQCPCDRWEPRSTPCWSWVAKCSGCGRAAYASADYPAAAPAPRVEAAAGVDPLPAGTLLACGHVMGDLRCGNRCPTPPSIAAPAPREPCCDLASRGTHRKGCTGEPMTQQLADALGGEAPLTDTELVAIRAILVVTAGYEHNGTAPWKESTWNPMVDAARATIGPCMITGGCTLPLHHSGKCRAAVAVAARKEPKPERRGSRDDGP